jgi:hypothetical protein
VARLLWGVCALLAATLGWGTLARADQTGMVNRLTLVPAWPGGPSADMPCFDLRALPPATFDVVIDSDLGGEKPEDYYAERLRLLAANYRVLVFAADEMRKNWGADAPRPLAVLGPDESGAYRLDQAGLVAGQAYAWVTVAQFETLPSGSATLWSDPLYFRTRPCPDRVPAALPAADQQALLVLGGLTAQQQRAALGEATALRGLELFYNFAAATDTFVCAPLNENEPCPWPDPPVGRSLPLPALLDLGDIASGMLVLEQQAGGGQPEAKRIAALSDAVQRFAGRAPGAPAAADAAVAEPAQTPEAKALAQLAGLGSRLSVLGRQPAAGPLRSLLSELGVAVDEVLSSGTRPALPVGVDSFPPYARATLRRLEGVEEYAPRLQQVFSPAEWTAWDGWLRQQRGELTLIAEDAERGRLSRQQLDAQVARDRAIAPPPYPDKWRYIDGQTGQVDIERVGRIPAGADAEQRHLARELYWFQLAQFARQLWPAQSNKAP